MNKKRVGLLLVVFFIVIFSAVSVEEWPSFNKDEFNSGVQEGEGFFDVREIEEIVNPVDGMNSQPLVADTSLNGYNEIVIFSGNYLKLFDYEMNLVDEVYAGKLEGQFDLSDVDSDAFIEIIAVVDNDGSDNFTIWQYDGNSIKVENSFDVTSQGGYQDIKCFDFDEDGNVECVYRDRYGIVHSYQADAGNYLDDELNINISDGETVGSSTNIPPSFADFDNDGDLDALFWFNDNFVVVDSAGNVVLNEDVGTLRSNVGGNPFLGLRFVNLDNAGDYEVAVGWRNDFIYGLSYKTSVYISLYDSLGSVIFTKDFNFGNNYCKINSNKHCYGFASSFFVTDYDKDGYDDIGIYLDDNAYSTFGDWIKILNGSGGEIASGSVSVNEGMVSNAFLADMDADGDVELILQKSIYDLNGNVVYSFSDVDTQPPIPVDIDKNDGLDLVWTKQGKTKFFIDDFGTIKIFNISINPINPSVKDDFNCSFIVNDSGTLNVNISWYKNDVLHSNEEIVCIDGELCTSSEISSSQASKGDVWKCSVVASSGGKKSLVKSKSVEILDSSEWAEYNNGIGFASGKGYFTERNITEIEVSNGSNYPPMVADIDLDSENELIIFSDGYLLIYNEDLELEDSEEVGILKGQFDVENVDSDGYLEIIAVVDNNGTDNFAIWQYDGDFVLENSFDVTSQGGYQDIKCFDFDEDGNVECVYRDRYGIVHSYQADAGNYLDDELNINISDGETVGSSTNIPPSFADFDNDGDLDALFWFNDNFVVVDSAGNVVLNEDVGTLRSNLVDNPFLGLRFVNLDNAGDYEVAVGWKEDVLNGLSYETHINLGVYSGSGDVRFIKTFNFGNNYCKINSNKHCYGFASSFFVTDYDKDGYDDIGIYLDDNAYSTFGKHINVINKYGEEIASHTVSISEGVIIGKSAPIADIDNDNEVELILKKTIYDMNGDVVYSFSDMKPQPPIVVDIDKNGGLDLIYSEDGKTTLFLDNKSMEKESLLEKYAPVLYFHPDEQFFPTTIDAMLNESDLMLNRGWPISDELKDEMPVSVESLNESTTEFYYLDMRNASGGLRLFDSGLVPNPDRFNVYPHNIYGRYFEADEKEVILQYWFFYPYNNFINKHEGDWEMIQIILNRTTEVPLLITYSFHWGGITYNWSDIEKFEDFHPKVFVTLGGHGSWSSQGNHSWVAKLKKIWCKSSIDVTSSDGYIFYPTDYSITRLDDEIPWSHFLGIWGEKGMDGTSGPDSPAYVQYGNAPNRWYNATGWARDPLPDSYTVCTGSPVNLHAYDSDGNHVGLDNYGNITTGISNTYLYLPSNGSSELISILTSEQLIFEVDAVDRGAFNLSINKYDRNKSTQITLIYKNINITNQTKAIVNITDKNPNFIMQIDVDGDGTIDTTAEPDNKTIEGNYTNEEEDSDNDGISDSVDNCPELYNPNQDTDFDGDGFDNLLCGGIDCDDDNSLINPDADEECNNMDDNCNDLIDENLTRVCGITDVGICTFGEEICESGDWVGCNAIFPEPEFCNNLDDDCDNEIDEDFNVGESCSAGIGECESEGVYVCSEDFSTTVCNAIPKEPSLEICDDKDNNCDGIVDNNCPRNTKEFAINLLEGLDNKKVDKVIQYIQKSLNLKYFIDNETLNPEKGRNNGQNVFGYELKAVLQCLRGNRFRPIHPICDNVSNLLMIADKVFALKALEDAKSMPVINPDNQDCVDENINKAESFIEKADDRLPKEFPSLAINLYKLSWQYSQKAIEIANEEKDVCKKRWWFLW